MQKLNDDYAIREMAGEELGPLYQRLFPQIFGTTLNFSLDGALSDAERENWVELAKPFRERYWLRLGIYYQEREFVGWSFGRQKDGETFYMTNTGILPEHQGKGIYTALLPIILERVKAKGFQIVTSRHHATNSHILVPKLKAGFVITGMELSDRFGLLVNLSYFFNPLRRQMLNVRSGYELPSAEVRKLTNLEQH